MTQATLGAKHRDAWQKKISERRIAQQPTADLRRTEFGLAVFGKPLRITNCDCERQIDPSLLQAIFLRNDPDLVKLLDRKESWLREISPKDDAAAVVREAYLRTVSRPPTPGEMERSLNHLATAESLQAGMRDLLWALVNTKEFITNH